MKNFLVLLFAFIFTGSLVAQDPAKDIKKAATYLGSYNLDPTGSADKLQKAIDLVNTSMSDPVVKADPTAWQTYGSVFLAAVNRDVQNIVLNPEAVIEEPTAPKKAFHGFKMAAELATKSFHMNDALKALADGIQNIYYLGSILFQKGDYKNAYDAFQATYEGYSLLKKNSVTTSFSPEEHPKSLYYSAICAAEADMVQEAKSALELLVATGSNEPAVYETLFNIYLKDNPEKAEALLAVAREKFPDNQGILFSEINYMLAKGETESLISKLEQAAKLDPANASIDVTMGQIYDAQFLKHQADIKSYYDSIAELKKKYASTKKAAFQDSIKMFEGRIQQSFEASMNAFEKAKANYQSGLVKDAKNFEANYFIAALWYNKAVGQAVELNTLSDDYTPEGNRKYEAKKAQMEGSFAESLPFFYSARDLKPEDENTNMALREIEVRFSDDDPAARVYATGTDGNCYYTRANGVKVFVDKKFCTP